MLIQGIARYENVTKTWAHKKTPDKPQWGITLLVKKDSPQIAAIEKELNDAISMAHPKGIPTNDWKTCWKDVAVEEPESEFLKDYMILKSSTSDKFGRPILVNNEIVTIIDLNYPIIGKVVVADIYFKSYDNCISAHLRATKITDTYGEIALEKLEKKKTAEQIFGAPAPVAPAPVAPAPVAPSTNYQMTEKAAGSDRDAFIAEGWTDVMLIEQGYMLAPNGITPSFS